MFDRGIDSALEFEQIASPTLVALHRTRSSDSLIAASDTSELSSWFETSSYFVVDPSSSATDSVSERSSEVDFEWAVSEECTRQLEEAMSASVHGESRSDGPEVCWQKNAFGCQGLNKGIPYITPPIDGHEEHNTEAFYTEDLHIRGGGCDSLDLDRDAIDSIIEAEVLTQDPCHQEQKGFKLSFFSRKKPSAPKPIKSTSRLNLGIRMPSVSSMGKLFGKQPNPAGALRNNPIRESKIEKICQPSLGRNETPEFFFDQQVEQKEQFVRMSNASTATLTLMSVEDMQTLNDALPNLKL